MIKDEERSVKIIASIFSLKSEKKPHFDSAAKILYVSSDS